MNWLDNIKYILGGEDTSPKIDSNQIKEILLIEINKRLPDFKFLGEENNTYIFRRLRALGAFTIYEAIYILSDTNSFDCSIAARLNPNYNNNDDYNTGPINPHYALITLKKGGSVPLHQAYYFHNNRLLRTTKVIKQMVADYQQFGIPFLNRHFKILSENIFLKKGLECLAQLENIDKEKTKIEIETQLFQGKHQFTSISHPIYINLKATLQNIKEQSKEDRKYIPKIAYELLELYLSDQISLPLSKIVTINPAD